MEENFGRYKLYGNCKENIIGRKNLGGLMTNKFNYRIVPNSKSSVHNLHVHAG